MKYICIRRWCILLLCVSRCLVQRTEHGGRQLFTLQKFNRSPHDKVVLFSR